MMHLEDIKRYGVATVQANTWIANVSVLEKLEKYFCQIILKFSGLDIPYFILRGIVIIG